MISVVVVDNVRVQEECSSSWGMSPLTLDWTVLRLVDNRLLRRSSGGKQTADRDVAAKRRSRCWQEQDGAGSEGSVMGPSSLGELRRPSPACSCRDSSSQDGREKRRWDGETQAPSPLCTELWSVVRDTTNDTVMGGGNDGAAMARP